ncbi:uncharacterized protein BJ212DRAFT_1503632 [Suillus subaureus]|uniref:Uncharacterized protein n=1 Tax=Suillus subaureus TaxID=48587 RepID=A0A9P7EBB0_9AGAM|nr:uncharacterized protein BJ212DRAFT_1503632 [Suillus subaureus]KAG1816498.1 hypothetical protein BJ212DRAFT_1503632 [Suillus subaureus]
MGPLIVSDKHFASAYLYLTEQYIHGPTCTGLCGTGIFQPWLYVLIKGKVTAVCDGNACSAEAKQSAWKICQSNKNIIKNAPVNFSKDMDGWMDYGRGPGVGMWDMQVHLCGCNNCTLAHDSPYRGAGLYSGKGIGSVYILYGGDKGRSAILVVRVEGKQVRDKSNYQTIDKGYATWQVKQIQKEENKPEKVIGNHPRIEVPLEHKKHSEESVELSFFFSAPQQRVVVPLLQRTRPKVQFKMQFQTGLYQH